MKYLGIDLFDIIVFRIKTYIRICRYYAMHIMPHRNILARTRALRGSAKGKKAFVFANGPSLATLDPEKIAHYQRTGYDVFAINSYISSAFSKIVHPDSYVLSDPAHFFFENIQGISDIQAAQYRNDLSAVISSEARLFLPVEFYHAVTYRHRYAFCDAENFFSSNVTNVLRPRGYLSQTAFKALSIASYLGYEKIYLCGLDNDYFKSIAVDEDNSISFIEKHFYNESPALAKRAIQDLMGRNMSMGEAFYTFHFNFKHLEKFRRCPIINLDKRSLVDCFDKKHDLDVYRA